MWKNDPKNNNARIKVIEPIYLVPELVINIIKYQIIIYIYKYQSAI
jgi:hypothetical protein